MDLLSQFQSFIKEKNLFQKGDRLLVAVSGGADSVLLTDLVYQSGYSFEIAHCNFQLRGAESDRDEAFVKALAEKYCVILHTKSFDTKAIAAAEKKSIETAARDLRYGWFNDLLAERQLKYLLTAHHADDNIETVAMNFFRGTGIAGLHGILPKQGQIVRPLLFARRAAIEQFANENKISFITDSSNLSSDYTRNSFRNEILPLIKKSFPGADKNVLQNICRLQEVELLYLQSIDLHKKKLLEQKGNEWHIPVLKLLKAKPLNTIVYEIIKDFGFTAHQTEEVINLLESETGKYIASATHRIIKNRHWLIIAPINSAEVHHVLIEQDDKKIVFSGGVLSIETIDADNYKIKTDPSIAQLNAAEIKYPLLLRKWKQGDYFYPLGMRKKKKLSRFLIDQKLSLTQKENVWVMEMNKKIIWIVGMRIDDRFKLNASSTKKVVKITLRRGDNLA